MADDIDIEEHDILENPRIKDILPHIDIKAEPEDIVEENEDVSDAYEEYENDSEDQYTEDEPPDLHSFNETGYYKEMSEYGILPGRASTERYNHNKIILGTKPCTKPITLGCKSYSNTEEVSIGSNLINQPGNQSVEISHEPYSKAVMPFPNQKLILGSKTPPGVESQPRPERVLEDAVVSLEDWSDRLKRSSCYCEECQTLFATRNALDAHNMTAHSFLVAMEVPIPSDNENTPTESPKSDNDQKKYCNHCDKYFPDDISLFQHLYNLYPSKEDEILFYLCPVCDMYFKTLAGFQNHTLQKHKITLNNSVKMRPFVPFCSLCRKPTRNLRKHTRHIYRSHYTVMCKVVNDNSAFFEQNLYFKKTDLPNKIVVKHKTESVSDMSQPANPKLLVKKIAGKRKTELVKDMLHRANAALFVKKNKNGVVQCLKCNRTYQNMKTARAHVRLKHLNGNTIVHEGQKLSNPGNSTLNSKSYLPKNLLFKCGRCSIHLLSGFAAVSHYGNTCGVQRHWTCRFCSKRLRAHDKSLHLLQHKNCNDIKTVIIKSDSYKRLLAKCLKCNIYFEERLLIRHLREGCYGATTSKKCLVCDINVMNHKNHELFHSKLKFNKSDFIRIDQFVIYESAESNRAYAGIKLFPKASPASANTISASRSLEADSTNKKYVSKDNSSSVKRASEFQSDQDGILKVPKLSASLSESRMLNNANKTRELVPNKLQPIKSQQFRDNLKRKLPAPALVAKRAKIYPSLFYCTECFLCTKHHKHRQFHVSKRCLVSKFSQSQCPRCGLWFRQGTTFNRHLIDHTAFRFDLKDVKFRDIVTMKPVMPSLPKFTTCSLCKLNYYNANGNHDCRAVRITCEICNEVFDTVAYKLHVMHHELLEPFDTSDADVSELIQKYDSLETTWNVLYNCTVCDLMTDSYDHVVDHSQKHLNNIEHYDVIVRHCAPCNMNFEEPCFKRHTILHSDRVMDNNSFRILKYCYEDLLTNDWLKIFAPLSKTEMKQITSRSIYATRTLRMRMILNGPPELTLYKCEACRRYVQPEGVKSHARICSGGGGSHICTYCHIPFSSAGGLEKHHKIHANKNITSNSYRIISFNGDGDRDFNAKLVTNSKARDCEECTLDDEDPIRENLNPKNQNKKTTFFQCQSCGSCSMFKNFRSYHQCSSDLSKCPECNYVTSHRYIRHHIRWHEDNKNITKKDISFVPFKHPKSVLPARIFVNLYKCLKCGVSQGAKSKHTCSRKSDIKTCRICKRKFSRQHMWKHMMLHASAKDVIFKVIPSFNLRQSKKGIDDMRTVNNATVFKCACGLHFTSEQTIQKHIEFSSESSIPSENCSKCGLLFPTGLLVSHLCKHHRNGESRILVKQVAKSCGLISNTENSTVKEDKEEKKAEGEINATFQKKENVLFKCRKCKIHFVSRTTFFKHINGQNWFKHLRSIHNCSICGLLFSKWVLARHIAKHHNATQNIVVFEIIEKECGKGNEVRPEIKVKETQKISPTDQVALGFHKCWCGIHFLTIRALMFHQMSVTNHNSVRRYQCYVCELDFTKESLKRHKETCNSNVNNLDNKLYRCDICNVNYLELSSLKQHNLGNHDQEKHKCSDCELEFDRDELTRHCVLHHKNMGLSLKDLIIIENNAQSSFAGKTKIRTNTNVPPTLNGQMHSSAEGNQSLVSRNAIFKCTVCNTHFTGIRSAFDHLRKGHLTTRSVEICNYCGLTFTKQIAQVHRALHHDKKNLSLKDFDIYDVISIAEKEGSIVYECSICHLHYMSPLAFAEHCEKCDGYGRKSHTVICDECNLEFSIFSIQRHKILHQKQGKEYITVTSFAYAKNNSELSNTNSINSQSYSEIDVEQITTDRITANRIGVTEFFSEETSDDSVPPTLNGQMHSSAEGNQSRVSRNALFKCTVCNTHFTVMRSAFDHLRNGHLTTRSVEICNYCGLTFTKQIAQVHQALHHDKKNLSLKDFDIYDIISIAEKEGSIVYECSICHLHYMSPLAFAEHCEKCDGYGRRSHTVICDECNLEFSTFSIQRHKILHQKQGKEYITVTSFEYAKNNAELSNTNSDNSQSYSEIDDEQITTDTSRITANRIGVTDFFSEETSDDSVVPNADDGAEIAGGVKSDSNIIYRCVACDVHYLEAKAIHTHHLRQHKIVRSIGSCQKCGLRFSDRSLINHHIRHHNNTNHTVDYLTILDFHNILNHYGKVIQRCAQCDIHYTTLQSFVKHIQGGHKDVVKIACTVCRLSFAKDNMTYHLKVHHGKSMKIDFRVETLFPRVMRIVNSGSQDITPVNALSERYNDNTNANIDSDSTESGEPNKTVTDTSDEFDASAVVDSDKFDSGVISATVNKRSVLDLNKSENIDERINNSDAQSLLDDSVIELKKDEKKYAFKLYKCGDCNVHFLNQNSCYKHTLNHVAMDPIDYIACKMCSLQFRLMSLTQHMRKHHQSDFKLEKVLVEEYQPKLKGEKTPKINIYYAIDKVQSRLVSTTTDDDKMADDEFSLTQSQMVEPTEIVASTSSNALKVNLVSNENVS